VVDDPGTIRECRNCGTNVERVGVGCPACGSGEIATYEV
jgi:RNA polymerase subunit RPABC4/transcription elongation factor Spt4